ncbi:hypothetical protein COEREDRAFT_40542 [Coemansia reversa NRRL 1564]|uniref:DNA mismatch repair proteins mutS family domain-containing protein n=1 Tax=Coemansia reversa (strain ATCC 12441 / NRRL 1564) TaxID=763665 RepID=A0A2G5BFG0_COERN|nr:hypothetical protein COEREDRAFT_40542 [Coemansia reversa NRRL 1564]|eukprot:PIA17731.1 hypothetical protein COEREDRAFT_40542 [Coemansia reversa NRRL 1564]
MSGLDFVDLTQIDSDTDSHSCENDDLYIIDVKIPRKRVKTEHIDDLRSESNACIESIAAPTSAYTEVTGIPNMLMVLTEGRGIASEIAFCLFNLATSQCMLSQFADSASYSRTIYAIVTSRPQVIFVPKAMAEGKSKAMLNIRKYLPWLTVVSFERKRFNDSEGYNVLQNIAIPSQAIQLTRVLHTKQYAYAALNALFYYLEHDLEITISSGSVNVTYKQMEGAMQIDPGAWRDLGLENNDEENSKKTPSLFSSINHTKTKMGARLLRSNILQPSTDLSTIYARQNAVLEILDNEKLFFFLSTQLAEFPDIDATITSLIRLPNAVTSRQINQAINNVLQVKHILQMTIKLSAGINIELRILKNIARNLFDKVTQEVVELVEQYSNEIQVPIKAVYKPSTGYIMSAKIEALGDTIPEEFVNVVIKKSVVTFTTLELAIKNNRTTFTTCTDFNTILCRAIQDVASVIRENIVLLYRVSEAIALLDMIVSFACHCTLHDCVVPEFSDSISIIDGRHPILETLGREVVPNNVNTTAATFTIVSGPNMGGKSTYLRQIIYIVIMAQIGSLVPAQSAKLKVFDKLFVRMNNNDNLPASESTFLREMHDIAYILQNYDKHSLLLIDELGRSTATIEGTAICRAICEELIESSATVFLTTHFLELCEILGLHTNCNCISLSAVVS